MEWNGQAGIIMLLNLEEFSIGDNLSKSSTISYSSFSLTVHFAISVCARFLYMVSASLCMKAIQI